MKLLNLLGWFCSKSNKPVLYSTAYITTVQDYMCYEPVDIWLYDRVTKKRRQATLRVPTNIRDSRKTKIATCVNIIHQLDAFIAMQVIKHVIDKETPIYTVHDNFITTLNYARMVPTIYIKVFNDMGPPLKIINAFIHQNIILYTLQQGLLDHDHFAKYLSPSYRFDQPIPEDDLSTILEALIPPSMTKGQQKTWIMQIHETLYYYDKYCQTVCNGPYLSPEDGGKLHAEKWKEFQNELDKWKKHNVNYSVHY